jgi:hypothetical protein
MNKEIIEPANLLKIGSMRELIQLVEDNPAVGKQYLIIEYGWYQYSAGITGINHWSRIFRSVDKYAFPDRAAALEAQDIAKIYSYRKKGKETPYGEIEGRANTVKIMTIKKICEEGNCNSVYTNINIYSDITYIKMRTYD